METSNNMNVEGEQNASARAPASPTTASTAAVQQALKHTVCADVRTGITPPQYHTLQVCRSSGSTLQGVLRYPPPSTTCGCSEVITPPGLSHPLTYHTPKHTLWVFGRAITPPGLSHPHIYHTPKRTPWEVGRAITPPGLSHPLGAAATSTLSPGLHKIPHPRQDTTPGDNIFKRSNVSPGVCYLV